MSRVLSPLYHSILFEASIARVDPPLVVTIFSGEVQPVNKAIVYSVLSTARTGEL
jgi:hypothetical protein